LRPVPIRYNLAGALIDAPLAEDRRAERSAIDCGDRILTYGQVADLVNRAGNSFRSLGVAREERIAIVLPDSPEFVAAFLGAIKIGAVAVPCSTFLGAAEYRYFLSESRARVLVTTADLLARMQAARWSEAPEIHVSSVLAVDEMPGAALVRSWQASLAQAAPVLAPADTHKDEPAFWLWTSGSTGEPKAAVHLHQDAPWCFRHYGAGILGMTADDRTFSAAKLFHAYGLGNALFYPFWAGATTILLPGRATPEAVYSTIDAARPTVFFGVPTLFAAMLAVSDADARFDLTSLRCCVSAGEVLPAELFLQWRERFGTEILDGLGSTELLHMYVSSRPGRVKAGSCGWPVDGYDVRVVDEQGRDVETGEVGDVIVRGPSTAIMYWNRRDQTKQKMRGEWFVTGDKYSVDADGYFWYSGRSDDMFKVAGEWISPVELEQVIASHAAVAECAIVPSAEPSGVLKPKAFVVLKDGGAGTDDLVAELQAFVRERAAHYKCPRAIEFLPELPRTATGKLQRFKLR
jgi:benzoate-CoA ligase family protein